MKIIIQGAGSKDPGAGYLRDKDDLPVAFRATGPNAITKDWVDFLVDYNRRFRDGNPHKLYPAWQLYKPTVYSVLCLEFGYQNIYILSAGWGLIRSDFLLPQYDVTFAQQVPKSERNKRRVEVEGWPDLNQFTCTSGEETIFLTSKSYTKLANKLIMMWKIKPHIQFVYAGEAPKIAFYKVYQPGDLVHFPRRFTNWHYEAARQIIQYRGLPARGFK